MAKQFKLRFVIAHGSYATGQPIHLESDLDIAVVGSTVVNFDSLMKLYRQIDEVFPGIQREIGLKSLNEADPLFP